MKKTLSIFGGIICFLICVFLFGVQLSFITFTSVKTITTKESIKEIVDDVDIKELIALDPAITSDIYGIFDTLGFSIEETNKIFEAKTFKKFLNEYLYNNIDNVLNDKDTKVDYEAIEKLVDDIEKETNIKFKNKQAFLKIAKQKYPEIEKSINISNSIKEKLDEEELILIKVLLGNTITIVFIVMLIITYLIMCLFRWSMYKPLIWYGITTSISSFIMLQVFMSINKMKELIVDESYQSLKFIIDPLLKVIRNKGLIISGITMVLGVLMVVIFYFVNKKIKETEKNENFEQLENTNTETF